MYLTLRLVAHRTLLQPARVLLNEACDLLLSFLDFNVTLTLLPIIVTSLSISLFLKSVARHQFDYTKMLKYIDKIRIIIHSFNIFL